MDFSIQQIYAMFAMLTAAAVAGLYFYCIGLRSGQAAGYEHGRKTAALHWRKLLKGKQDSNDALFAALASRNGEIFALRQNIRDESEGYTKTIERLRQRIAATPFNDDDQDVLSAVFSKLQLAARTFDGLNSPDHARFSRHLQAKVLSLIERIKAAEAGTLIHPDKELIDWLEDEATVDYDLERCMIGFFANPSNETGGNTLRDVLTQAKADSEAIARNQYQILLAAEQEAAA